MWLDHYDGLDDAESVSSGREQSSEQYQEKAKKVQIQLKKIQKDEKQAKWDNQKLFLILSRFIADPYYENFISDISSLLAISFPSRGVIAFISLFYPDATFYVSDILGKKEKIKLLLALPRLEAEIPFDEKNIPTEIRTWMSEWIVLMDEFLLHESASILMNKKILEMISGEHFSLIERIVSKILIFFFKGRNIVLDEQKSREYSRFILKNIHGKLQKYLTLQEQAVKDLITDVELTSDDLFGI